MVNLLANDDKSWIELRDGYLPTRTALSAAAPKRPSSFQKEMPDFDSLAEAAVWTIHRIARRYINGKSSYWGGSYEIAVSVPFDMWVIGRPTNKDGLLAPLFEGESENTAYRILIHRTPFEYRGETTLPVIGESLRASKAHLLFRQKKLDYRNSVYQRTREFIEDRLLPAYHDRPDDVTSLIESVGHSYDRFTDP